MSCFYCRVFRPLWGFKRNIGYLLAYFSTLTLRSPCLYPFVTRDHNRGTTYLGEGWLAGKSQKGAKSRYSVNLGWLKPYTQMYGVLIQVGSDAYMYCNFLTHILLHNIGVKTFIVFFFQNSLP